MALKTFGSTSTSALSALQWVNSRPASFVSDLAAFNAAILTPNMGALGPINPAQQIVGPTVTMEGIVYLPANRGKIRLQGGDWIVFDPNTGWPTVVSLRAVLAAGSNWTHS